MSKAMSLSAMSLSIVSSLSILDAILAREQGV